MLELFQRRRSIRKYQDRPLTQDQLDLLVKAALLPPSSRNNKPWEFVFVTDKELLKKLAASKEHGSAFLQGAVLGIVVIADPAKSDVWIEDVAIASTYLHLMATELGLGSCWIQIRERFHSPSVKSEDYIKELLNIPENYRVGTIIAVGYPDEAKDAYKVENLGYDKVNINNYGEKYFNK
ncbi:MAG: nitroreductase family protein [Syntrophomonadaceae bacterium]|jgi:nitroreductase